MNKQQIFDTVVKHLATQKVASVTNRNIIMDDEVITVSVCAYRGLNGTKCAVGCLIKDEDYSLFMETVPVNRLVNDNKLPAYLLRHVDFLRSLQLAHDTAQDRQDISFMLKEIAKMHDLDDATVELITQWIR